MKTIYTKKEFFMSFAPQFNFELDQDQLIKEGLKRGFITKVNEDQYRINENY